MQTDIILNTAIYMTCTIKWLDSGEIAEDIVICISELDQPQLDDDIFYYCHDVAEIIYVFDDSMMIAVRNSKYFSTA